jgi:glycosyltransferase involved in cell wall biosynthesis
MPDILSFYLKNYRFDSISNLLGLTPTSLADSPRKPRSQGLVRTSLKQQSVVPQPPITLEPVTVVVPCFNEERVLPYLARMLDALRKRLDDKYVLSFLLIDDGSTDGSYQAMVEQFGEREDCDLIRHSQNQGIAAAILTGIQHAKTEVVCSIDCDGSYDPHQLEVLIPLLGENVALVTASPYHALGDAVGVPAWRLTLSRGLSHIYRHILNHKFATYTSCFRVYRKSAMEGMKIRNQGFLGVVEMLTILDLNGSKIVECPAVLEARILGHSKMKTIKTILGHAGLLLVVLVTKVVKRKKYKPS